MIDILLAEDHNIVRDGLKSILQFNPEFRVVAEAHNGNGVVEYLGSGKHLDIILTDMNMPVMGGLDVTRYVMEKHPAVKVIILSALDHEEYVIQTFKAGAAGYVLKSVSAEELSFAIKHVSAGNEYICSELTMRFLNRMITAPEPFNVENIHDIQFSGREIEVLSLISEGFTNQEIADKLFTSKRTVEGHRQSMIDKTGVRNTPALVKYALLNGIIN